MNLLVPLDPIISSRKSGFPCTTMSIKEAKMDTNFGLKFVHNSTQQLHISWYCLELAHTVFNSDICINRGNIGIHLHAKVHFKTLGIKENTPSRVMRGGRSLAGIRRRIPMPDASKWSPDSHHLTNRCYPFIPYFFCFFEEEMKFVGQHFYYVIHHAVPRGGGSRSFLCDTLSSTV